MVRALWLFLIWYNNILDTLGNIKYIEINFVCFFSFFHVNTQRSEVKAGLTFHLMSGTVQVDISFTSPDSLVQTFLP